MEKTVMTSTNAKAELFDWRGRLTKEILDRIFTPSSNPSSLAELNRLRLVSKPLQRYAEQRTTQEFIRIHEWVKQTTDEIKEKIGPPQRNRFGNRHHPLHDHYQVVEDVEGKMASTLAVYGRLTRDYGCFAFLGRFADECRKCCEVVRAHSLDAAEVRPIRNVRWVDDCRYSSVDVGKEVNEIYGQLQRFLEVEKFTHWVGVRKKRHEIAKQQVDVGVNSDNAHNSRSKSVGTQTEDDI